MFYITVQISAKRWVVARKASNIPNENKYIVCSKSIPKAWLAGQIAHEFENVDPREYSPNTRLYEWDGLD